MISDKPAVLAFAPVCWPPAQPEAIVNAKLFAAMIEAGWHVDIITNPNPKLQWYPSQQEQWAALLPHIHRVAERPPRLLSKLWYSLKTLGVRGMAGGVRWGVPAYELGLKLARQRQYDVILSRAMPDVAHLPAMMLSRKTGIAWVANWNDPQPRQKFPPPYGQGPQAPLDRWQRLYYRAIVRHCRHHTFPSERLRQYMASYLAPLGQPLDSSVIPHIALDQFSCPPIEHPNFVVCYAGSLRPPRSPRVLLEGLKQFWQRTGCDSRVEARFIVDRDEGVLEAAREYKLESVVRIVPPLSYEQMPQAMALADVLVIIEAPVSEGIFLPSKMVDYAQAGKPILALSPRVGVLADLLAEHGGGVAVDSQSPPQVADVLEAMYLRWKGGTLFQEYSSASLMKLFDQRTILESYLDLLSRLS